MAETQDKHYHIGQAIWNASHQITDLNKSLLRDSQDEEIENVVKFGITTIPGVKFNFNKTEDANNDTFPTIEIGRTGFFELDLKDLAMTINSITVAPDIITDDNKTSADIINENYCYIDFIYYTEN